MNRYQRRLWANDIRALLPNPLTRVDLTPLDAQSAQTAGQQSQSTSQQSQQATNAHPQS